MVLLFEAIFAAGFLFFAFWITSVVRSAMADRRVALIAEAEARKLAEREASLQRPGEPLRCLNCDASFVGPLTDDGCPNCHLTTLVVPAAEYEQRSRESVNGIAGQGM
jgi:hypothetical protein